MDQFSPAELYQLLAVINQNVSTWTIQDAQDDCALRRTCEDMRTCCESIRTSLIDVLGGDNKDESDSSDGSSADKVCDIIHI